MKRCSRCKHEKPLEQFYVKHRNPWCKQCLTDYTKKAHAALKARAVKYKGGCCTICSYSKHDGGLVFHHIDPSQKDFGIASAKKWEKVQPELDKCVLLCHNCHSEVHAGVTSLPSFLSTQDSI